MTRFPTLFALCALTLAAGCQILGPNMTGDWDIDVVDADDCTMELELEQEGDDLEGEADIECRLFFTVSGESYYYDLSARGVDVDGDIDGDEFELEIEFYDDFFEDDVEMVLFGELDGDDIDGDIELFGDDWGEFEGRR